MRLLAGLLLAGMAALTAVEAQPAIPRLTAPVNDFAEVLDRTSEAQLEDVIRKLQGATGDVIAVATIDTFKPFADLPSYAVEMFENGGQGIGQKGKDNGVLIVLAVDDRQVRIETGYGLEGFITDGFAGETSRAMVPYFRDRDYGRGLLAGTTRLAQRIADGRNVDLNLARQARRPRGTGTDRIPLAVWVALAIPFLLMRAMRRAGLRSRRRWSSGVGPFGGGYHRRGGWSGGGGFGGGFGGFGGGRSGGGGGGASW